MMVPSPGPPSNRLQLLTNHIYEYRKDVLQFVLYTGFLRDLPHACAKLESARIHRFVQNIGVSKVNIYFGNRAHVEMARHIVDKPLARLSPEEDFILGVLLGYDREQQCRRYLDRANVAACA